MAGPNIIMYECRSQMLIGKRRMEGNRYFTGEIRIGSAIYRYNDGWLESDGDKPSAEWPDGHWEYHRRSVLHRDPNEGPAIIDLTQGYTVDIMQGKAKKRTEIPTPKPSAPFRMVPA